MGFCIGITAHHGVLDGKTTTLFIKSWAYICKQGGNTENSALPPELTPFFDRNVFKDPNGLDMLYLNQWIATSIGSDSDTKKKSLKVLQNKGKLAPNLVRATFEITREDLKKLRERVLFKLSDSGKELHLSTFVLTLAYVTTCLVKAGGGNGDRIVGFGFTIDCRPRLNPPVPENYFGNCNTVTFQMVKARDFLDENGFFYAVQKVSGMVKELSEKGVLEGIENKLSDFLKIAEEIAKSSVQAIGVAGSPRFDVYSSDFGWGKPLKVIVVSIDKSESISIAESRDGSRGVEVGLALKNHEMVNFSSLFLKDV
ncbi:hypothetical protein REPUB_Repub06bG0185200 [Reevesia pubescens]